MASFLSLPAATICPFWADKLKEALKNLLPDPVVRALTSRDRYAGQFNSRILFEEDDDDDTLPSRVGFEEAYYDASSDSDDEGLTEGKVLSRLKTRGCDVNDGEETCAVCLDSLLLEDDGINIVAKLECGHEYHIDCIKPWLQTNNRCPTCRATAIYRY